MDLSKIQDLIKFVADSGVHEVELETKDFKITVKGTSSASASVAAATQPAAVQAPPAPQVSVPAAAVPEPVAAPAKTASEPSAIEDESKYITIKSPMIGTFYRASSPDKPPFVSVGDSIETGSVICIIEAMKLFNEIEAEISGKIVKILADDASPVEYDQPLFLVDPS